MIIATGLVTIFYTVIGGFEAVIWTDAILVAKSDREALKGVAFGALLCVPAWMLFMLIGTEWSSLGILIVFFPPIIL